MINSILWIIIWLAVFAIVVPCVLYLPLLSPGQSSPPHPNMTRIPYKISLLFDKNLSSATNAYMPILMYEVDFGKNFAIVEVGNSTFDKEVLRDYHTVRFTAYNIASKQDNNTGDVIIQPKQSKSVLNNTLPSLNTNLTIDKIPLLKIPSSKYSGIAAKYIEFAKMIHLTKKGLQVVQANTTMPCLNIIQLKPRYISLPSSAFVVQYPVLKYTVKIRNCSKHGPPEEVILNASFNPKSLPNGVNATFNPKSLIIAPNGNSTSVLSLHLPDSLPKKNSTTFTIIADAYVRVNFLKNFPVAHDSTRGNFTISSYNH